MAQMAPIPSSDELSGQPYAIQKSWVIGGVGEWDYLTLDPAARQLFITHQTRAQVVDVDSGTVAGEVTGFSDAHAVVLDPKPRRQSRRSLHRPKRRLRRTGCSACGPSTLLIREKHSERHFPGLPHISSRVEYL